MAFSSGLELEDQFIARSACAAVPEREGIACTVLETQSRIIYSLSPMRLVTTTLDAFAGPVATASASLRPRPLKVTGLIFECLT